MINRTSIGYILTAMIFSISILTYASLQTSFAQGDTISNIMNSLTQNQQDGNNNQTSNNQTGESQTSGTLGKIGETVGGLLNK